MTRRLLFGIQTIFSENPCGVFFPVETTRIYLRILKIYTISVTLEHNVFKQNLNTQITHCHTSLMISCVWSSDEFVILGVFSYISVLKIAEFDGEVFTLTKVSVLFIVWILFSLVNSAGNIISHTIFADSVSPAYIIGYLYLLTLCLQLTLLAT